MGDVIGYAWVSTDSQSAHDQIVTLKQAWATRILSEKLSGRALTGRWLKLTKHQQAEALRMLAEEDDQGRPKYTQAAVARLFNCGQEQPAA
jgi:hypothetical protein